MQLRRIVLVLVVLVLGCESPGLRPTEPVKLAEFAARPLEACDVFNADVGAVDAVLAIDASRSTIEPTGADINQNGQVGKLMFRRLDGNIWDKGSSDLGDSFLSAQVTASLSLVRGLGNDEARFAVVAYSGALPKRRYRNRKLDAELTNRADALEAALERVLEAGSYGNTDFTAGIRLAGDVLGDSRAERPASRKVVLFMSDSGKPFLTVDGQPRRHDPTLEQAAHEAAEAGIMFHTFGLGAALTDEPNFLAEIAADTGGAFFPVADPTTLHCELAAALMR